MSDLFTEYPIYAKTPIHRDSRTTFVGYYKAVGPSRAYVLSGFYYTELDTYEMFKVDNSHTPKEGTFADELQRDVYVPCTEEEFDERLQQVLTAHDATQAA